jgi:predicted N-acyltransferase
MEPSPNTPIHLRPDWDRIVAGYESGTLYHSSGWLSFLEHTQDARVIVEPFSDGLDGYHVAALVRKGPFQILGSPLPGWTTVRMGPLFNRNGTDQSALAAEIGDFGKRHKISMFELVSWQLDDSVMIEDGWSGQPDHTMVVPLPSTHQELWDDRLKSTCRNRIRKAQKNGLTVEIGLDDKLVDDVWDRVDAIFRHQDLVVSYDKARIQALYDELAPRDRVVGVRVIAPDGHLAACGIFPFDDKCIYFWAGASRPEDRALVPNELMHYELMCHAIDRGITSYDMCGGGDYKKKFGAERVDTQRWLRYYNPLAKYGRATVSKVVRTRQKLAGRARNVGGG